MTAAAVAFAILLAGLSATLLIDNERIDFNIDTTGVVAAPRDQHQVGESTVLSGAYGVSLHTGKLTQKANDGEQLTGQQARAILEAGQAALELDKGALVIGSPLVGFEQRFSLNPPLIQALRSLNFSSLDISQGRISVILPSGRKEWLFNVNMMVKPAARSQGLTAQGSAVWRGHKIQVQFDAGARLNESNELPAKVKVSSPLFSIAFDGKIGFSNGLELVGNTVISGKDTRHFARSLRIIWPEWAGISDFEMSSPMAWTSSALTLEKVSARFDDNEATGIVAAKGSPDKAQITGTLAFETLDLTRYWSAEPSERETTTQSWWGRIASVWSEPLIRHFDADLRMSAKKVVIGDYELSKAAATVALKDGKLSAQLAKLSFAGGSGSGQITIDQRGLVPKTSFHGKFVDVPLGDLTSSLFGRRGVEGRATIIADLRSEGLDHGALVSSLNGDVRLEVGNDGVIGFDLNALATKALSEPNAQPQTQSNKLIGELLRGTTRLAGIKVDLGVESGQLMSKKFEMLSDDHKLQLSGNADLVKQTVDVYGALHENVPATTDAASAQSQPTLPKASEGGRSIRLTGSFSEPRLEVRENQAATAQTE